MQLQRILLLAVLAVAVTAPRPGAGEPDNPFAAPEEPADSAPKPEKLDIVCAPWDADCQARSGGGARGSELVTRGSAVCWGRGSASAPYRQPAAPGDAEAQAEAEASGGVQPVSTSLQFQQLSASAGFVCGLTTRGSIACWGSSTPMDDSDLEYQPPTEVAFGAGTSRGQAASAGEGAAPAAAPAPAATDAGRVDAAAVGRPVFTKVVTGDAFSCGLLRNGSAACFGQLPGEALWTGPESGGQAITPTLVGGPGVEWADLAAGGDRACGVLFNGSLACFWAPWAYDSHPFCGNVAERSPADALDAGADANGTTPAPALAADPSLVFTTAAVVDGGACGLLANGSVACVCGYADAAQEQALPAEPRLLFNGTGGFSALAARGGTVCGVGAEGGLVCSGVTGGFLTPEGFPDVTYSAGPTVIDASRQYAAVSVGGSGLAFHACGLTAAGEALCWGLNSELQLGSAAGGGNSSATPAPVDTPLRFAGLAAGGEFTCGVVA